MSKRDKRKKGVSDGNGAALEGASGAGVFTWVASHVGFVTLALSATAFAAGFVLYANLCGKAFAFGIPLEEVPVSVSFHFFLLIICLTMLVMGANFGVRKWVLFLPRGSLRVSAIVGLVLLCAIASGFVSYELGMLEFTSHGGSELEFQRHADANLGALLVNWPIVFGAIFAILVLPGQISLKMFPEEDAVKVDGELSIGTLEAFSGAKVQSAMVLVLIGVFAVLAVGAHIVGFVSVEDGGNRNMVIACDGDGGENAALVVLRGDERLCVMDCEVESSASGNVVAVERSVYRWVRIEDCRLRYTYCKVMSRD